MKKNIYTSKYITIVILLIIFVLVLFYIKRHNIEFFKGGNSGDRSNSGGGSNSGRGSNNGNESNIEGYQSKVVKTCANDNPVVKPDVKPKEVIDKKPSPYGPLPSPIPPAVIIPPKPPGNKDPIHPSKVIPESIIRHTLPLSEPLPSVNPISTEHVKEPIKKPSNSNNNNNVKLGTLANSTLRFYEKQIEKNTPLQVSILQEIELKQKELEEKKRLELNQAKEIEDKGKVLLTRSRMLQINQDRSSYRKKIIYSLLAIIFAIFIITIIIYILFFKNIDPYTRQPRGKWVYENVIVHKL